MYVIIVRLRLSESHLVCLWYAYVTLYFYYHINLYLPRFLVCKETNLQYRLKPFMGIPYLHFLILNKIKCKLLEISCLSINRCNFICDNYHRTWYIKLSDEKTDGEIIRVDWAAFLFYKPPVPPTPIHLCCPLLALVLVCSLKPLLTCV